MPAATVSPRKILLTGSTLRQEAEVLAEQIRAHAGSRPEHSARVLTVTQVWKDLMNVLTPVNADGHVLYAR